MAESIGKKSSNLAITALILSLGSLFALLIPVLADTLGVYLYMGLKSVGVVNSANSLIVVRKIMDFESPWIALLFFIFGPAGLICAIISLKQIRRSKGALTGKEMAIISISIFILVILVITALVLLSSPANSFNFQD